MKCVRSGVHSTDIKHRNERGDTQKMRQSFFISFSVWYAFYNCCLIRILMFVPAFVLLILFSGKIKGLLSCTLSARALKGAWQNGK